MTVVLSQYLYTATSLLFLAPVARSVREGLISMLWMPHSWSGGTEFSEDCNVNSQLNISTHTSNQPASWGSDPCAVCSRPPPSTCCTSSRRSPACERATASRTPRRRLGMKSSRLISPLSSRLAYFHLAEHFHSSHLVHAGLRYRVFLQHCIA